MPNRVAFAASHSALEPGPQGDGERYVEPERDPGQRERITAVYPALKGRDVVPETGPDGEEGGGEPANTKPPESKMSHHAAERRRRQRQGGGPREQHRDGVDRSEPLVKW
jgi:hypothetical protein